jgi:hypothetical protein
MTDEQLKILIDEALLEQEFSENELAVLDPYLNELVSIAKKDHLSESPKDATRRAQIQKALVNLVKAIN